VVLKPRDVESLHVQARSRLHSVCSMTTTVCLDICYQKGSRPDGVCEAYPAGRCGIISVFLSSTDSLRMSLRCRNM